MNILADENMPLTKVLFEKFGNVNLKHGRKITADDLIDIDVLLVRSITKVNKDLLSKANKLKFVGTATAGFDHIDTKALEEKGIAFSNAQGCNKISVGEYVLSSLLLLQQMFNLDFSKLTMAVIGAGCTGSEVIRRAKALGLNLLISDPPLKEEDSPKYSNYVNFKECLNADIISFHVPLIKDGSHPTYHMLNKELFEKYYKNGEKFIINASRGEVIDDLALNEALDKNPNLHLIKDVWEEEPSIKCKELIKKAIITTPHIAGYSYEGKCRGTFMLYEKLCQMENVKPIDFKTLLKKPQISEITIDEELNLDIIRRLVHLIYDVRRDSNTFRLNFNGDESFDALRKNYLERRELSSLLVNSSPKNSQILKDLGFSVKE